MRIERSVLDDGRRSRGKAEIRDEKLTMQLMAVTTLLLLQAMVRQFI
jgi:hypothetical protein